MSRIWLIRHAASVSAARAIAATDPLLSDQGREQAGHLAAAMASRPLLRILSSDRRRALATALILAEPHGLAVEPTSSLRELDFGAWEGRSLSDLWSEEPEAAKAWESDIRLTPPSFGESVPDLERRVATFWTSLQPLPAQGEIAIVSHRGTLAVLRALITGETVADTFASGLELAAAIVLPVA